MPYITVEQYRRVAHILDEPATDEKEVAALAVQIYALNKRIRAFTGPVPSPEWSALMLSHGDLLAAYRRAGGRWFP